MTNIMKSFLTGLAVLSVLAVNSGAQAQNQSLGDYARAIKKTKPAEPSTPRPKVYENDNLPTGSALSVVGNPSASADSADTKDQAKTDITAENKSADPSKADAKANPGNDKKQGAQLKPGQSAADRNQAIDAWQKKLDGQKDKISFLSRELDVLQGEYRIKVAEFYSDTARRTQNPNALFEDDAKYKQQISDKQKSLDDAKSQLTDMQEDARHAGAPNSITE